jgi:Zn-dependent protease with chaperone function
MLELFILRKIEYRADLEATNLVGFSPVINGLKKIWYLTEGKGVIRREFIEEEMRKDSLEKENILELFSSHPNLRNRIKKLEKLRN